MFFFILVTHVPQKSKMAANFVKSLATLTTMFVAKAMDVFSKLSTRTKVLIFFCFGVYLVFLVNSHSTSAVDAHKIKVLTWNLAAINNNPFEYWLTLPNEPKYDLLMNSVEKFILSTKPNKDQPIGKIFPVEYFDQLMTKLQAKLPTVTTEQVNAVRKMYVNDFSQRAMVTTFLKDAQIGKKRLVSMPDRMTNTIQTSKGTFYRPTPINCYTDRVASVGDWFAKWTEFMFDVQIDNEGRVPVQLLKQIPRSKYPDLSEEEEALSVPLQVLMLGIFDAIQIRMLNQVSLEKWRSVDEWQKMRISICDNLNFKKTDRTLDILAISYADADILFLQEASDKFVTETENKFSSKFHVVVNRQQMSSSDQNSVVLLSKAYFTWYEIVTAVQVENSGAVASGDLLVVRARDILGRAYLLASFHGDTNGLATIPALDAVLKHWNKEDRFVFGMDANTYESTKLGPGYQSFAGFVEHFSAKGLESCWGKAPDARRHTTRNARTYMQPQLSKAAGQSQIVEKGDANPKDFILYSPQHFQASLVGRDNTGAGRFVENMVFPTLDFPSDHAVVRMVLGDELAK